VRRAASLVLLLFGAVLVTGCSAATHIGDFAAGAVVKPEGNPPCNPWPHPGGQC
jgi:hypothetical protein